MKYVWDFSIIGQYMPLLLQGAWFTIKIALITSFFGLLGGLIAAFGRISGMRLISWPMRAFTEFFRCMPVLVLLVWTYYALPVLIGVELTATMAAVMTLSLYGASFFGEIIRAGLLSIEQGQWDAGRALGMTSPGVVRHIILPQALKRMIPPLVNQFVLQLKNTSLVSVVAVPDLLYQGQIVTAATYRPLEVYTVVATMYFIILVPMTQVSNWIEVRMKKSEA